MALLACSMAMKIVKGRSSFYSFFPETIFFGTRLEWQFHRNYVPYSRKQKHELLFEKSEILLFKVSITNMPEYFVSEQNFFCFKDRELKFSASY